MFGLFCSSIPLKTKSLTSNSILLNSSAKRSKRTQHSSCSLFHSNATLTHLKLKVRLFERLTSTRIRFISAFHVILSFSISYSKIGEYDMNNANLNLKKSFTICSMIFSCSSSTLWLLLLKRENNDNNSMRTVHWWIDVNDGETRRFGKRQTKWYC